MKQARYVFSVFLCIFILAIAACTSHPTTPGNDRTEASGQSAYGLRNGLAASSAGDSAIKDNGTDAGKKPATGANTGAAKDKSQEQSQASSDKAKQEEAAAMGDSADLYCDSLLPSYAVADNLKAIVMKIAPSAATRMVGGGGDLSDTVKQVSKSHVWIPVKIEQAIGEQLRDLKNKKNKPLEREGKNNQRLYKKAGDALDAAARNYKNTPYTLELIIVEGQELNAEAIPGGYIYIESKAVEELDNATLQLVLGHEVAHIAKRHNSKQLQQRLIDMGMAQQLFQKLLKGTAPDQLVELFRGEQIIQKFTGIFAEYQQVQELQADACAIREMVRAEPALDPVAAREQYKEKRGAKTGERVSSAAEIAKALKLDITDHPDDPKRDAFFAEAKAHHVANRARQASR